MNKITACLNELNILHSRNLMTLSFSNIHHIILHNIIVGIHMTHVLLSVKKLKRVP